MLSPRFANAPPRDYILARLLDSYNTIAICSDGGSIVASSSQHLTFFDESQGQIALEDVPFAGHDTAGVFFSGRKALVVKSRSLSIVDPFTFKEEATLVILRADTWSGTWAVLASTGLFDSGDIESARDLFSVLNRPRVL